MKQNNKIHNATVLIVGAGQGGLSLLKIFKEDPTIEILGIVDINPDAKGLQLAKEIGVKTSKYAHTFTKEKGLVIDVIIDVTGVDSVLDELRKIKNPKTRVISGIAAKFLWTLVDVNKDKRLLQKKYDDLKITLEENPNDELIFGTNPQMLQIKQMIYQVAATPATVLVTGETGTGKEIIASTIHQFSHLRDKTFVKINCTAFSPSLLESELFGYKKGAFTGALKDKTGLLEKGNKGTIFLDEIGDISLDMQVKLLRFLQFGEIRPVGSTETKIVNTRIIAATNRNLEKLIRKKKFRKDLYYRLNSFILDLPPLRKRKEDIPVLAYHFLQLAVLKMNKKVSAITPKAIEYLNEYDYPGNLRELQSIIERAVILCQGSTITIKHLPLPVQSSSTVYNYKQGFMKSKENVIDQFERQAIQYYLINSKGNVTKAALAARVPRRTFYRLLEKHKISKNKFKKNESYKE